MVGASVEVCRGLCRMLITPIDRQRHLLTTGQPRIGSVSSNAREDLSPAFRQMTQAASNIQGPEHWLPWRSSGSGGASHGHRWLGVEFRHLGALAAVAREGSFRQAALSLGYVQSSISAQIAYLERVVGTQLVERSSGIAGTSLTVAGRVLCGHVEEILARFEAARIDVRAVSAGAQTMVSLGVPDSIGSRALPFIMRAFSKQFPDCRLAIRESRRDEINFERLVNGELDLMITELPVPEGPFEHTLIGRDPYVLLVPADSLLAKHQGPLNLSRLSGLQLLVPEPSRADDALVPALRANGLDPQESLRPRSLGALQALVGAGLGASVLPALAVNHDDPATVAVDLPGLLPERQMVLVRHRERDYTAGVRALIEITRDAFDERCI